MKRLLEKQKEELISYWKENKIITDEKVIGAFRRVKRENFVLPEFSGMAYEDIPLPIMAEQTISQPTTVMLMTQALEVGKGMNVLEVGAGSGYQAALLSRLVGREGKIISIEIIKEVYEFAKKNLKRAGVKNVNIILGDGSIGFEKEAPYDRIILTAAAPKIPPQLAEQLKNGGIMIIPVDSNDWLGGQDMIKIIKDENGKIRKENLGKFSFVPLKGREGYS